MPKASPPKTPGAPSGRGAATDPAPSPSSSPPPTPAAPCAAPALQLLEIRPGLFLNTAHVVSIRVLPQEDGNTYAVMQMSNADKLQLTRAEFAAISGQEPRLPARMHTKAAG